MEGCRVRSVYADDPRVEWFHSDASSNMVAYLPDLREAGIRSPGRAVMAVDGGFVVQGMPDKSRSIRSTRGALSVFVSVDEALRAVLDAPISGKVAPQ
jgi:hypothetical protein